MEFTVVGPIVEALPAWRLIGDSDWLNRIAGNGRLLDLEIDARNDFPRARGRFAAPGGQTMSFEETQSSWVQGQFFTQHRRYQGQLMAESRFHGELVPQGEGVQPRMTLELIPASRWVAPLIAWSGRGIRQRWQAALDALPKPGEPDPRSPLRSLPIGASRALDRWEDTEDADLVQHFREYFLTQHPLNLQRMRAFSLADQWGFDREQVLTSMLRGVEAGAVELYWSIECPRCHGEVSATRSLSNLADHGHCATCRVDFASDLGEHVEVLFAPHPAIALRTEEKFCTLFPAGSPHQLAVLPVAPGETRQETLTLPQDRWHLGTGGSAPDTILCATSEAEAPHELLWSPNMDPGEIQIAAGEVQITLVNPGDHPVRVTINRHRADDARVLASRLTLMPAFRRQMGHQALSPDIRISVRSLTILFTDLTGSTAMYEAMGDAAAFAFVRDHFTFLRTVVEEHGGVVIKTMGDAIMCAFHDPLPAVQASLSIQERFPDWADHRDPLAGIRLRIGLHRGTTMAVHTDASGLDYFGQTVNIAARVQHAADADEVMWTEAVYTSPGVKEHLDQISWTAVPSFLEFKGLSNPMKLYRVTARPPPQSAGASSPRVMVFR